jgi:hypothetical protein
MKTAYSNPTSNVPAIAETVDFTNELDALGGNLPVSGARRIRKSGFYNKASRRPAGGASDYALKAESPILVKLVDGTVAVASAEGVEAYASRTGQSPA